MSLQRQRRAPVLGVLLAAIIVTTTRATDALPASDLPRLMADSVNRMVDGLSNVEAQEDFTFRWKKPTVRSHLRLVRYPGSDRHLLVYRDVTHFDGKPLPNREAHRNDLFQGGRLGNASQRALEIAIDSNAYVPAVLNPLFAIAFLQSEYQTRFELAEKAPGRDWPGTVRALTFRETTRPTLLRSGVGGKANVPTRGMAWIDTATGRILQTELELSDGGKRTKLTTTFGEDARLHVTVPISMRADNPDSTATYSNFRRFGVETQFMYMPREPR